MNLQLRVSGDERMNERKSANWNFPTSRVRNWYIRGNKFIILKEFNTIITVLGLKSELIKVKNFSFLFARTFASNTLVQLKCSCERQLKYFLSLKVLRTWRVYYVVKNVIFWGRSVWKKLFLKVLWYYAILVFRSIYRNSLLENCVCIIRVLDSIFAK